MKLSILMRPLSMFFFLMPVSYMLYCLNPRQNNVFAVLISAAVIFISCFFLKMHKNKTLRIILCILLIFAAGFAEFCFIIMPVQVFMFWMIFLIANLIGIIREQKFMERSNELYTVVFILVYAAAYAYEVTNMYVMFMLFGVFVILKHLQNVSIKNEEQLSIISNYSVVDEPGILLNMAKTSLKTGFIMLAVCLFVGLAGNLGIFNTINGSVGNSVKNIAGYINFNKEKPDSGETEVVDEDYGEEEMYIDNTPVHPFWRILGIAGTILAAVYLVFLIADKIITIRKNRVYMPDFGTEERIILKEDKDDNIWDKRTKPEDYSFRKTIRRIYRSKIKKGRGKRNDDLITKTPSEQCSKKISEGYTINAGFVELYERARYSGDIITRQDVKKMQEVGK